MITHGIRLSILFALASSKAPALHGLVKSVLARVPGCKEGWSSATGSRREGERVGDEKERRYRPMKNSSLRAQQTNKTTCPASISFLRRTYGFDPDSLYYDSSNTEPDFCWSQFSCGFGSHHPCSVLHTCACNGSPNPRKLSSGR